MGFEKNKNAFDLGKKTGYFFAYCVFTAALFFILKLTKRELHLFYVICITFCISLLGILLKRFLK
jgi:hypothetical protein